MKRIICSLLYAGISAISWYYYYTRKKEFDEELLKAELLKMHKCVVIYGKMRISGWPEFPGRYSPDLSKTRDLYRPVRYFIATAERELKISVMYISALPIIEALNDAVKRGVKVQIIVSFETPLNLDIEKLAELGAELRYYVGRGVESIMHYKYAIKDCDEEAGFILYGSLNWTASGFLENYEDCIFTNSTVLAQEFKRNFNITWDRLTTLAESEEVRDTILEARHNSRINN